MGEDADVLRFRLRGPYEDPDGFDPDELSLLDDPHGGQWSGQPEPGGALGLGTLTQVVMVGDQVLDVVRRPISGSGYECAALELEDRGLYRRPGPPPSPPRAPMPPPHEQQLAWLARIVGGEGALAALGVDPLEPEELCLDEIRPSLHERVRGIDSRLRRWASPLLGDEGPTATRRLLIRAVAAEPALVTRSDRDDIAAGAVMWAVAKGNDLVGTNRPVRASVLQDVFGLRSTPSGRGSAFAQAVGGTQSLYGRPQWMYHAQPDVVALGSPDLLLSRFRRQLVLTRDLALVLRARTPAG